jgi:hypothetical protein
MRESGWGWLSDAAGRTEFSSYHPLNPGLAQPGMALNKGQKSTPMAFAGTDVGISPAPLNARPVDSLYS